MARTRTRSTIEEKIEAQKLIVSKAKDSLKKYLILLIIIYFQRRANYGKRNR